MLFTVLLAGFRPSYEFVLVVLAMLIMLGLMLLLVGGWVLSQEQNPKKAKGLLLILTGILLPVVELLWLLSN